MVRALLALVALSLVACWSLTTDVPDLTSGSVAADASDDGAGPVESGGGDAGTDQSAGGDAGTFCSSISPAPTLCDDFDQGALGARWSAGREEVFGGTLTLESAGAKSPPQSLLAAVAQGSSTDPGARLQHDIAGKPTRVSLSFDFRLEAPDSDGAYLVAGFPIVTGADKSYRVDLAIQGGHFNILTNRNDGQTPQIVSGTGPNLTINDWVHVDFEVTFFGTPSTRVAVDGVEHVASALTAVPEPTESATVVQLGLYVGPPYPTSANAALRFDNVVYRATVR